MILAKVRRPPRSFIQESEFELSSLMARWSYFRAGKLPREDGLVALEYVILAAIVVALIGAGMTLFQTDLKNAFDALL